MKTFKIEIVETLAKMVDVKADTLEQAIDKVKADYINQVHVLDYQNHVDTQFREV